MLNLYSKKCLDIWQKNVKLGGGENVGTYIITRLLYFKKIEKNENFYKNLKKNRSIYLHAPKRGFLVKITIII